MIENKTFTVVAMDNGNISQYNFDQLARCFNAYLDDIRDNVSDNMIQIPNAKIYWD